MLLHPTITFEQFRTTLDAIAATKPKARAQRTWKEYTLLAVVCLASGISIQIPAARIPAISACATFLLLWIFSAAWARQARDRYLKAIFCEEQQVLNDQVLSIDDSGISCDRANGGAVSHHTWKVFIKQFEMPDAYIFLPSPNSFIRVPKAMLSTSDCELLLQWSSGIPRVETR